jgi:hypothetical protein
MGRSMPKVRPRHMCGRREYAIWPAAPVTATCRGAAIARYSLRVETNWSRFRSHKHRLRTASEGKLGHNSWKQLKQVDAKYERPRRTS